MAQPKFITAIQENRSLAFHYKNYNWFLAGSFLSRTGEWFDRVALNWFVFTMTDSALYIGLVEFCRLFPILLFSFFGGMAADIWDRRKVLLATQIGSMVSTFALAFVLLQGVDSFFPIAVVILIRGVFLSFEIPTRNALVANLIPKHALTSGLSFYSATLNTSRIIGPAIAGILLGFWAAPSLILINGVSFLAVILTLFYIRPENNQFYEQEKIVRKENSQIRFVESFKEMTDYLKNHPLVLGIVILGIVPMVFGFSYITLMPVFAKEILHAGSQEFGMLLSAAAIGAVLCSFTLGWGKYPLRKGELLFICILAFGIGLMLFSMSHSFVLSMLLMFIVGIVSQGYRVIHRVMIQEIVPDHLRGRILSIVTMDAGFLPLGSLLIGFLAQHFGAVPALFIMGFVCVLTTVIVVLKNRKILFLQ
ncbi:MFS transporter [Anaerobacillus sp. MEB173]|uniref:MFS transporter n=1 Tax=Anaerobacillus sp. MEB173 TaxID=3383345 RepID=UPI003F9067B3